MLFPSISLPSVFSCGCRRDADTAEEIDFVPPPRSHPAQAAGSAPLQPAGRETVVGTTGVGHSLTESRVACGVEEDGVLESLDLHASYLPNGQRYEGLGYMLSGRANAVDPFFQLNDLDGEGDAEQIALVLSAADHGKKSVRFAEDEQGMVKAETKMFSKEHAYLEERRWRNVELGIGNMRKLLRFIHQWRDVSASATDKTAEAGRARLQSIQDVLGQSEPVRTALQIFSAGHSLSVSCSRYTPSGSILPAGLVFFEDDLQQLAEAQKEWMKCMVRQMGDLRELRRLSDKFFAGAVVQHGLPSIGFNREQTPTNPHLVHRWNLSFEGDEVMTTLPQAPVLFWGEFLRATSSGWGERAEDPDLPGVSRKFEVMVLHGHR